jgi:UDP-4-amino-4,6-dideoxy-N-acetyl-beta-L-altrosamine N-acetyltransferase
MTEEDLPLVLTWRNSERVRRHMVTRHAITWEEHTAWFLRVQSDPDQQQYIFELDGAPVGVVGIGGLAHLPGAVSWGFYVGDQDAPKGTGSRMLAIALERVFAIEGVQAVNAEVVASNTASIRVHERLGFKNTGTVRREQEGAGATEFVMYALTPQEWRRARESDAGDGFSPSGGGSDDTE